MNHSKNAIVKPQGPSPSETKREVEEALRKVREANMALLEQKVAPVAPETVGIVVGGAGGGATERGESAAKEKEKENSSSKQRTRSRSRSRSRTRLIYLSLHPVRRNLSLVC